MKKIFNILFPLLALGALNAQTVTVEDLLYRAPDYGVVSYDTLSPRTDTIQCMFMFYGGSGQAKFKRGYLLRLHDIERIQTGFWVLKRPTVETYTNPTFAPIDPKLIIEAWEYNWKDLQDK